MRLAFKLIQEAGGISLNQLAIADHNMHHLGEAGSAITYFLQSDLVACLNRIQCGRTK